MKAGPLLAVILFFAIGVLAIWLMLTQDVECEAYTSSGECVIWSRDEDDGR